MTPGRYGVVLEMTVLLTAGGTESETKQAAVETVIVELDVRTLDTPDEAL